MPQYSEGRVTKWTQIISTGGIVIAVEFEPMIVHQSSCKLIASALSGRVAGPYLGLYLQTDAAFKLNAPDLGGVV